MCRMFLNRKSSWKSGRESATCSSVKRRYELEKRERASGAKKISLLRGGRNSVVSSFSTTLRGLHIQPRPRTRQV